MATVTALRLYLASTVQHSIYQFKYVMEIFDVMYTYPEITTPNLHEDISNYVLNGIDEKVVKKQWDSFDSVFRDKLNVLAERLEFISKLEITKLKIKQSHKNTIERTDLGKDRVKETEHFKCTFLGEDFSGVHLDIESLQIYLLITCLDTLAGQFSYQPPFEWLKSQTDQTGIINSQTLDKLSKKYKESFGLTKLFIEQFTDGTSKVIQKLWLDNFICCATANGNLVVESKSAWDERKCKDKLKSIAEGLYKLRSTFSHMSARSFLRTLEIAKAPRDRKNHLVRVGEKDLFSLLNETIKDIATSLFYTNLPGANSAY